MNKRCANDYSGERCARKNSSKASNKSSSLGISLHSIVIGFGIGLILCILAIISYYVFKLDFICKCYRHLIIVKSNFKFNKFNQNLDEEDNDQNDLNNSSESNKTRTNVVRFAKTSDDSVGFTNLINDEQDSNT